MWPYLVEKMTSQWKKSFIAPLMKKRKDKEGYVTPSLVPKLSSDAGVEKRTWYPLFAHALNFIRNLVTHQGCT